MAITLVEVVAGNDYGVSEKSSAAMFLVCKWNINVWWPTWHIATRIGLGPNC